jgi:hypothetical protein
MLSLSDQAERKKSSILVTAGIPARIMKPITTLKLTLQIARMNMLRAIKAHPGVFIGGAITYALITHVIMPRYGSTMKAKLPTG